ncbi:hypothetical protein J2X61_004193 [Bacillus sp. 3255]|nr:hypothetical protein [Bacillus sp. 3255]
MKNFLSVFSVNDEPKYYPIPCRGCRKVDWDFINLTERAVAELGPWGKYLRNWYFESKFHGTSLKYGNYSLIKNSAAA